MLALVLAVAGVQSVLGRRLVNAHNANASSAGRGDCAPRSRYDCGYFGIQRYECEQWGCCWAHSWEPGVPLCFHTRDTGGSQCMIDESLREECGYLGIRKIECETKGCCWGKKRDGRYPWCYTKAKTASEQAAPKRQPVVYHVETLPWLEELGASSKAPARCGGYVCLKDVPEERWIAMKNDGADMVWLEGVWRTSGSGHPPAGGPRAIVDYTVNPDIGTDSDLAALRKKLHSLGMQLMVDFAPNDFAKESTLWKEHPEAFMLRSASDRSPDSLWAHQDGRAVAYGRGYGEEPRTGTLQVNFFKPEAVKLMADQANSIAERADGIRLGRAHLMLTDVFRKTWHDIYQKSGHHRPDQEFWDVVIRDVKRRHPDTTFVSEAQDYGITQPPEHEKLLGLGVDYSYSTNKLVLDNANHDMGALSDFARSNIQRHFTKVKRVELGVALKLGANNKVISKKLVSGTSPELRGLGLDFVGGPGGSGREVPRAPLDKRRSRSRDRGRRGRRRGRRE